MPMGTGWRGAPGLTGNPGHVLAGSSVPTAGLTARQCNFAGKPCRSAAGQLLGGALRADGRADLLQLFALVVGLLVAHALGDELLLRAVAERLELVVAELLQRLVVLCRAHALVDVAGVGDLRGARSTAGTDESGHCDQQRTRAEPTRGVGHRATLYARRRCG